MNKNYMLAFGSLRETSKKGYNFQRFGKGSQKLVKEVILDGFEMYNLGSYPAVANGQGKIKCELQLVSDAAFRSIRMMESGAGYDEQTVDVDGIKATIFTMPKETLSKFQKVESGDWA